VKIAPLIVPGGDLADAEYFEESEDFFVHFDPERIKVALEGDIYGN